MADGLRADLRLAALKIAEDWVLANPWDVGEPSFQSAYSLADGILVWLAASEKQHNCQDH